MHASGGGSGNNDASMSKSDGDEPYPFVIHKDGKYMDDENTFGEVHSLNKSYFYITSSFITRIGSSALTPEVTTSVVPVRLRSAAVATASLPRIVQANLCWREEIRITREGFLPR